MRRKKICVVTGSRAEYGLLHPLLKRLAAEPGFTLLLVATGAHLEPRFGSTYREIEKDGFRLAAKVRTSASGGGPRSIARSMGLGLTGFGAVLARLQPDLLVAFGDRYEIFAAAAAALIAKIPIAHIGGGETTEGAYDEAIRHSVTKMSHYHFVTSEDSARRVRQLGEDPRRIFNVGSLGTDRLQSTELLDRSALEAALGFRLRRKNLLVTFHPETLEKRPAAEQFDEVLAALGKLSRPDLGILFTFPNADTGGMALIRQIRRFVRGHENARAYASLGSLKYLSLIAQVDAVVGNSSSGIYEVPSFKRPTVNIGDRQKGRAMAASIINCRLDRNAIRNAVLAALELDCSRTVSPYGKGGAARKIVAVLRKKNALTSLTKKHFFDLPVPGK